jgi:uncharacterized integral membrane protein
MEEQEKKKWYGKWMIVVGLILIILAFVLAAYD